MLVPIVIDNLVSFTFFFIVMKYFKKTQWTKYNINIKITFLYCHEKNIRYG